LKRKSAVEKILCEYSEKTAWRKKMRKRMNLYKVVDQNGKQVFENLLTAKQVTEKTGCTKNNVAQAAANFALVNKKYRIIPEDIKLSKALDVELLAEWDRYRKWMLKAVGRMK
jgi:hypothetical protein